VILSGEFPFLSRSPLYRSGRLLGFSLFSGSQRAKTKTVVSFFCPTSLISLYLFWFFFSPSHCPAPGPLPLLLTPFPIFSDEINLQHKGPTLTNSFLLSTPPSGSFFCRSLFPFLSLSTPSRGQQGERPSLLFYEMRVLGP